MKQQPDKSYLFSSILLGSVFLALAVGANYFRVHTHSLLFQILLWVAIAFYSYIVVWCIIGLFNTYLVKPKKKEEQHFNYNKEKPSEVETTVALKSKEAI